MTTADLTTALWVVRQAREDLTALPPADLKLKRGLLAALSLTDMHLTDLAALAEAEPTTNGEPNHNAR
jgi:hypothetical protein